MRSFRVGPVAAGMSFRRDDPGLESFADVPHGGSWHIGVLAAPGIPEMLLADREGAFLGGFAFPAMTAVKEFVHRARCCTAGAVMLTGCTRGFSND